jgi:hypothetical protein
LSVNLQLQHPLWPSALIVVLLTSSSIIRRVMCFFFFFFVGCQSRFIIVFSCVYTPRLEYVTSWSVWRCEKILYIVQSILLGTGWVMSAVKNSLFYLSRNFNEKKSSRESKLIYLTIQ